MQPSQLLPEALADYPEQRNRKPRTETLYGDDDTDNPGDLLSLPEAEAAAAALKLVTSQDTSPTMQKRFERWKVNRWRRAGVPNVALVKSQDQKKWVAWAPRNIRFDASTAMNKAKTLCRRFVALLFADPPAPLCVPSSSDDVDVEAAIFDERVLNDVQSESALYDIGAARKAFNLACHEGSGFVWYYIHDRAGGKRAIEIEAGPEAETVEDATERDVVVIDELTGAPTVERQPWPELTQRYVRPDGTLTDVETEAAFKWLNGIKREVLSGRNVRFFPPTAEDIWDADGLAIPCFKPWGQVKSQFADLAELSEEAIEEVLKFRPENADDLMSPEERRADKSEIKNDRLCYVQTTIYKACGDYPDGCYVVTVGEHYAPYRETWVKDVEGGRRIVLDIPVTQYKQFDEEEEHDPYGVGIMDNIGAGNTLRGSILGFMLDHFERFSNRKTFVPTNSIVQPSDMNLPTKTFININPGGKPEYESIPDIPKDAYSLLGAVSQEMDSDSGLEQAAQAVEDPNVQSGIHAQTIIGQVHAGLSEPKQNVIRGYTRACRIQLQLIAAFYDEPRTLKWSGEDGRYREKSWRGSDLGSTIDVRIKPGTMTMMTPAQKTVLGQSLKQEGIIDDETYRESVEGQLGGTLGLQDDPVRMRIRRQLSEWSDGPPEGWAPPPPAMADPMTGVVAPPAPDPAVANVWESVPADEVPDFAKVRYREIARFMQSYRYTSQPKEWRASVDAEFAHMAAILSPPPAAPAAPPPPQPVPVPAAPVPSPEAPPAAQGIMPAGPSEDEVRAQQRDEGVHLAIAQSAQTVLQATDAANAQLRNELAVLKEALAARPDQPVNVTVPVTIAGSGKDMAVTGPDGETSVVEAVRAPRRKIVSVTGPAGEIRKYDVIETPITEPGG